MRREGALSPPSLSRFASLFGELVLCHPMSKIVQCIDVESGGVIVLSNITHMYSFQSYDNYINILPVHW